MSVSLCSVLMVVVVVGMGVSGVAATGVPPPQDLTHRVVLDQTGSYVMLWTPQENDIVIEVQVSIAKGKVL